MYGFFQHPLETNTYCVIDGKMIKYDACGTLPKEECDIFYNKMAENTGVKSTYLGQGNVIIIGGRRNEMDETHHFYSLK